MQDEQIERMLSEVKGAFVVSETMRPFRAVQRLFTRVSSQADAEECRAFLQVLALAVDRFKETSHRVSSVAEVLLQSVRSDGLSHPPSVAVIARRVAVTPDAVEDALRLLAKRGLIEELPPKGFMFRRRRFRLLTLDPNAFTAVTLGAGMSTTFTLDVL